MNECDNMRIRSFEKKIPKNRIIKNCERIRIHAHCSILEQWLFLFLMKKENSRMRIGKITNNAAEVSNSTLKDDTEL